MTVSASVYLFRRKKKNEAALSITAHSGQLKEEGEPVFLSAEISNIGAVGSS